LRCVILTASLTASFALSKSSFAVLAIAAISIALLTVQSDNVLAQMHAPASGIKSHSRGGRSIRLDKSGTEKELLPKKRK